MAGRSDRGLRETIGRPLVALLIAAGLATGGLLVAGAADAATDSAQLTLTGLSDNADPAGGSQIGVRPNDYVKLGASAAPTTQAKTLAGKLGLGSLLSDLLGTTSFQVKADFSRLPGGAAGTVLAGSATKTFHFTKAGTYYFTWQAEKVTTGLLGKSSTVIAFDGNQAKQLGISVNGTNTYSGAIVVATNPPKGGISVQLPKIGASPKVGNVTLPKVNVPGVNLPTVRVSVPDLTKSRSSETRTSTTKPSTEQRSTGSAGSVDNQLLPVPARVLGGGATGGDDATSGGSNGSGYYAGSVGGVSPLGNGQPTRPGATSTTGTGSDKAGAADAAADDDGSPSAQLPVVLAIIAIVALSLVASLYARLFLLRRASAG